MKTSSSQKITFGLFSVVCLHLGVLTGAGEDARRSSLDSPKYDAMKAEFLNVDPALFSEVVFPDHFGDTSQDLAKADGENLLELRINEGGFMGWHTFGGTYWADDSLHGGKSLARYMTGGSPHNNSPVGGSSVDNDYATALAHPDRIYKRDTWTMGSGTRLWIGAGSRRTFLLPLFEELKYGPANRLCFEVELPEDRMRFLSQGETRDGGDPGKAQLMNPEVAHDNLDWVRYERAIRPSLCPGGHYIPAARPNADDLVRNPHVGGNGGRGREQESSFGKNAVSYA